MHSVLTLIACPTGPELAAEYVRSAEAALRSASMRVGPACWLADGLACDIPFDGPTPTTARAVVATALEGQPFDVAAQPAEGRRKRLLVADMDSTMIEVECIDELADYVGRKPEVAAITERAMRGEIDFVSALKARAAMLKGLDTSVFGEIFAARVRPTPGADTLVATMRAHGAYTALVSGGFTEFTGRVADLLGFDQHRANRLIAVNGRITGEVSEPVLGAAAKLEALEQLAAARGLPRAATLAVGDGANDLPMIRAAGLGVAFHAKPVLATAAGVRIDHGDLTALLYLQGYSRAEFARPRT